MPRFCSGLPVHRDEKRTAPAVLERRYYEQHPPGAEYLLTEVGKELRPVLKALFEWGQRHTKYRADAT